MKCDLLITKRHRMRIRWRIMLELTCKDMVAI